MNIDDFKKIFEPKLNLFLDKKIEEIRSRKDFENEIFEIISHTIKIIRHGGKRVRPYMAYLGGMMSKNLLDSKDLERFMEAIVGIELFHNFALIHDDIIDTAEERHGVETVHAYVSKKNKNNRTDSGHSHIGNSYAILVGDLIFAWSKEVIYKTIDDASCFVKLQNLMGKMIEDVLIGQMIDVSMMTKKTVTKELIDKKDILKTAKYSFVHPLMIGNCLAKGDFSYFDFYEKFGVDFGIAYQMQDDLLDVIGETKKTGKDNLRDLADGQHTYLTQYIYDNGTLEQKKLLSNLFGRELIDNEKKEAIELFHKSGAVSYVKKEINNKIDKAESFIEEFKIESPYRESFFSIVNVLRNRMQ